MRTILICTVGTSLINSLLHLKPEDPIHQAFHQTLRCQDWADIAQHLLDKAA